MQGQVVLTPKYFRDERNNYSCWQSAFWRELFQNSVDAGATKISIDVYDPPKPGEFAILRPDGGSATGSMVFFEDNGCGMTEDILRNVYFRLGETTKDGETTQGGFGKARMLTCFSHYAYGIETLDNVVVGEGSLYSVSKGGYVKGCKLWVDVDNIGRYGDFLDLRAPLIEYLSYSQLSCEIKSNVPGVNGFNKWLYKNRLATELSFGSVYTNKNGTMNGWLIVRCMGAMMFTKPLNIGNIQVVVELEPSKAKHVLVSNRDSLKYEYQNELDRFLQFLAVDRRAALRKSQPSDILIGDPKGACQTVRLKKSEALKVVPQQIEDCVGSSFGEVHPRLASAQPSFVNSFSNINSFDQEIPSIVLMCESDSPAMRKAMWLFNPSSGDGRYFGNTKRKLTKLWAGCIGAALEIWLEKFDQEAILWRPGFFFSDDANCLARHVVSPGTKIHHFLLNPVHADGKIRYSVTNRDDLRRLLRLSAHEVSHITYPYHNEDFSYLSEWMIEQLWNREKKIVRSLML